LLSQVFKPMVVIAAAEMKAAPGRVVVTWKPEHPAIEIERALRSATFRWTWPMRTPASMAGRRRGAVSCWRAGHGSYPCLVSVAIGV